MTLLAVWVGSRLWTADLPSLS